MRLLDWVYRTTYYYGFRSAIALAPRLNLDPSKNLAIFAHF
jgi:hypothetical protein